MIYHPCDRIDCIHNSNSSCTFYVGDLHYSICIDTASNYETKDGKKGEATTQNEIIFNNKGEITW